MEQEVGRSIDPNITSGMGNGRYPNPFFDLAQQYMPPTIKELFKWCTFYYYSSPLIGSAVKKVSRYPITDLIFESDHESTRTAWSKIFNDTLRIKDRLMEINLDYHVYGNCFVSIHLPFTRFLICPTCRKRHTIESIPWRFSAGTDFFSGTCTCGYSGKMEVKDVPYKDPKGVKIIRWNPRNISIKYNEFTGRYVYMYSVPHAIRKAIHRGDKDVVQDMPLVALEAVTKRRMIRLNNDNLFHLKNPTLAEQDQGWGKPAIVHILREMFYYFILRRAQEAVAQEHIVPFDIIYPTPNGGMDPYMHTDLGNWRNQIETAIQKHRKDPNYKAVIPVPVGFGRLGGDGKALLLGPEIAHLTQTTVGGMGIPQEFLFGGLNYCLVKSTLCTTSKGLLRLDELCPDDIGADSADFSVLTKDGVEKAALVHHTEKRKQVKIRMRSGITLTGSPIHRVWTIDEEVQMGWKQLQNFKPGEFVALKKPCGLWGSGDLDLKLCRLLGYLVSEGSVSDKKVSFGNSDESILEDFLNCFEAVVGYRPALQPVPSDGLPYFEVQTKNQQFKDLLKSFDMHHYSHTKRTPKAVRESRKECVAEFLKALFSGDGGIVNCESKQSVFYNSASERLIEEVQLLLLNFGIVSTRYGPYNNTCELSFGGTNNTTYRIDIRSEFVPIFMNEIGFSTERKNGLFKDECNRDGFRCEVNKIPYVIDNLKKLRIKQTGSAWIRDQARVALEKEEYTTKEVALLLKRDSSSVLNYIRNGKLEARKGPSENGRYASYIVKKGCLEKFLESYGVSKQTAIGQTTWELTENNVDKINWDGVEEIDPSLFGKIQEVRDADHWWDRVEEVTFSYEEVEMYDLTIYNTHSYVANGVISHNTGSSISLRTLENDFVQNRSQLLDFTLWLKNKLRTWLSLPDLKSICMADFRMADDVQRNQQLIGLNAQGKVSNQTLLTELGYDHEEETKKMIEEAFLQNYMQDLMSKGSAKSQGEASIIGYNYQQKLQEMAEKAQEEAQKKIDQQNAMAGPVTDNVGTPTPEDMGDRSQVMQSMAGGMQPGMSAPAPVEQDPAGGALVESGDVSSEVSQNINERVERWATQLTKMDPTQARNTLAEIKNKTPDLGKLVEKAYNNKMGGSLLEQAPVVTPGGEQVAGDELLDTSMKPLPEGRAPTRGEQTGGG